MNRRRNENGDRKRDKARAESRPANLVRSRSAGSRSSSTSVQPRARKSNRRRIPAEETKATRVHGGLGGGLGKIGRVLRARKGLPAFALVGLGLAAIIVVAVRGTRAQLEESEMFMLDAIEVRGASRSSAGEIEGLLGVQKGDNLIALDTQDLENFVRQHPWVREVRVRRELPKKLLVEVKEHEPVALVALGHLYYADADGSLVKRRSAEDREVFPVITGFSRADVESADQATIENLRRAVGFPRLLRETLGPAAPEIDEVHFDGVMGLSFVPKGEKVWVHMGPAPWESQIRRLGVVRMALREKGLEATEVTLGGDRRPERVAVKLARARG